MAGGGGSVLRSDRAVPVANAASVPAVPQSPRPAALSARFRYCSGPACTRSSDRWRTVRYEVVRGGNVDQTRGGIERHRRPVVRAARPGVTVVSIGPVVGFLVDDRPSRFFVQTLGPGHFRERLAGNELAGDAVRT